MERGAVTRSIGPVSIPAHWVRRSTAHRSRRRHQKRPFESSSECPGAAVLRCKHSYAGLVAARRRRDVVRRFKLVTRESERQVLLESWEEENWVHRSVVKK